MLLPAPSSFTKPSAWPTRLWQAGLLTGCSDGLFALVLSFIYYGNATRVFQGVASTLLGPAAMTGGTKTALVGVAMHFGVAFGWSVMFLALYTVSVSLRRRLGSTAGAWTAAAIYGPAVWVVMSLAVIPLLLHRPPTINFGWWVQLIGHIPCVGVPIVFSTRWGGVQTPGEA